MTVQRQGGSWVRRSVQESVLFGPGDPNRSLFVFWCVHASKVTTKLQIRRAQISDGIPGTDNLHGRHANTDRHPYLTCSATFFSIQLPPGRHPSTPFGRRRPREGDPVQGRAGRPPPQRPVTRRRSPRRGPRDGQAHFRRSSGAA